MGRKVLVLRAAQQDYADIKRHVLAEFGISVWQEVNQAFKTVIQQIGMHPEAGAPLEALQALGLDHFRQRLVRQTRVIYEFDDEEVVIHLFLHTRQDFRAHLERRMLR